MQNPGPPEMGSPCLEPHHSSLGQTHSGVHTGACLHILDIPLGPFFLPATNHFLSLLNSKPDTADTARHLKGSLLWWFNITQLSKIFS